jgi:hypothetical protein
MNLADHSGFPPVFLAIRHAQPEILLRLLARGADKSLLYKGNTALHCAVRESAVAHAELLIAYGYAIDAPNQERLTPIQLAQKLGRTEVLAVLDNPAARQRLLMNPKQQFPLKKVGQPPPEAPPAAPAPAAPPPPKKEEAPARPPPPKKKEKPPPAPRPEPPPPAPPPRPEPAQQQPSPVLQGQGFPGTPTGAFHPGFQGGYVPYPGAQYGAPMYFPQQYGGQVFVLAEEWIALQRRILWLESATAQVMNGARHACSACRAKVGTNQCPACGGLFCTPDWAAHVAHGCH